MVTLEEIEKVTEIAIADIPGELEISLQGISAEEFFMNPKQLDGAFQFIRRKAMEQNIFTIDTEKGRKGIASLAYEVRRSKTLIEKLRKHTVAELKAKPKLIDIAGKKARDFCDALIDEIRAPLTEWETQEALKMEAKRLQEKKEEDELQAYIDHEQWKHEREIEAREAALAKQEEERRQKEEEERRQKEQKERDKRVAKEAAEAAEQAAQAKINEAQRQAEKAKRDKIATQERAKLKVKQAKEDAERKLKEKQAQIKEEQDRIKAEQARREADKQHRLKINEKAASCFTPYGFKRSKKIISLIEAGKIEHVYISY